MRSDVRLEHVRCNLGQSNVSIMLNYYLKCHLRFPFLFQHFEYVEVPLGLGMKSVQLVLLGCSRDASRNLRNID